MSITRITRLDGFRIFRDFSWPGTLPDFKRFNLIYGWNGSGKTTLSSLFRHLETREPLTDCKVTVSVNNHDVSCSVQHSYRAHSSVQSRFRCRKRVHANSRGRAYLCHWKGEHRQAEAD